MKIILVGCGFLGNTAADLFLTRGHHVHAICKTPAEAAVLHEQKNGLENFSVEAWDVTGGRSQESGSKTALCAIRGQNFIPDALVFCTSTRGGDAAAYRALYHDAFECLIGELRPKQTVFVSSASVYGQKNGEWVDETSETVPAAETARVLLEAETLATTVLRLVGLHGRDALQQQKQTEVSERWVNRIHRDDAATAIVHAVENDLRGIYNVCDGMPILMEVPCSKRGDTNKRVSNAKLQATGWKPAK